MTVAAEILVDLYGRVRDTVHRAVDGLDEPMLTGRVDPAANSIAWLIWHLTRVQDDHIADVAGTEQVWSRDGFDRRFALPFDTTATGYGHTSEQVAQVRGVPADLLLEYHDAAHGASVAYLSALSDEDLGRIVDRRWDPPVTLAVRLVSVASDGLQHAGQAAFVRGVLSRLR